MERLRRCRRSAVFAAAVAEGHVLERDFAPDLACVEVARAASIGNPRAEVDQLEANSTTASGSRPLGKWQ